MPIIRKHLCLFCFFLALVSASYCQTLDASFNPKVLSRASIYDAAQQSDGKIIVVGNFDYFSDQPYSQVVRLNLDGSIDNTFNAKVVATNNGYQESINKVLIQQDSKILVFGNFTNFNGASLFKLARLKSDGSLDTGFTPPAGTDGNSTTGDFLLQPDGKIVYAIYYYGTSSTTILRLNADGTADNSFSKVTVSGTVYDLKYYNGGQLIVGGSFTQCNGTTVNNIVVLNNSGAIANSLGTGVNSIVYALAIQSDNKIIICSGGTAFNGTSTSYTFRLNSDFSVDQTYSADYNARNFYTITLDASDRVIGGGSGASLTRLKINGSLDTNYVPGGSLDANDYILSITVLADGKILALGRPVLQDKIAYRLNTDFTSDASLNVGTAATVKGTINKIDQQSDGKIIVAGAFSFFNGVKQNGIVRLNKDLSIDNTFLSGTGFNGQVAGVSLMYILPDDEIILGGSFYKYNNISTTNLIRLNYDGSYNLSYQVYLQYFRSMVLQDDGKIIVGGQFMLKDSSKYSYLKRFNFDGSVDNTFKAYVNNAVGRLAKQKDGKILINGGFTSFSGTKVPQLIRITPEGILDASFNSGLNSNLATILSIIPQASGRILIGGYLNGSDSKTHSLVALKSNGTFDSDFILDPAYVNTGESTIYTMKDSSFLLASGTNISRFFPTGAVDASFASINHSSTSTYSYGVWGIVSMSPTSFLAFGGFDKIAGAASQGFAHFSTTAIPPAPAAPTSLTVVKDVGGRASLSWKDNSTTESGYVVQRSDGTNNDYVTLASPAAGTTSYLDATVKANTTYYYRVAAFNTVGNSLFSNEVNFQTSVVTGIEDNSGFVSVYPNPGMGKFSLQLSSQSERLISITNMQGVVVQEVSSSDERVSIDLTSHPAGIYLVHWVESSTSRNVKILKL